MNHINTTNHASRFAALLTLLLLVPPHIACDKDSTTEASAGLPLVEPNEAELTINDAVVPVWWTRLPDDEVNDATVDEALAYQAPDHSVLETRVHFLLSASGERAISERYDAMSPHLQAEHTRDEERLAGMPRIGAFVVASRPRFALVELDGIPRMMPDPRHSGTLIETRSGSVITDVDITVPHTAIVRLPNYQTETVEIIAFGSPGSQWQQNRDSGVFVADVLVTLTPESEVESELTARMNPSHDSPELAGQITIRSNPSGANIVYDGRPQLADNGQPLTTPATFTEFRGRGGELRPVTLDPHGVPIRLELDGYAALTTGVYTHIYRCSPRDGVDSAAPFWQQCDYQYDTGELQLMNLDTAQAQYPGLGRPRATRDPTIDSIFRSVREEGPPPGGSGRVLRTGTIDTGR